MNKKEAAAIIDLMIKSIKTNPNQFQIEINVIGQSISNVSGGIGLDVSATGGEPGSTTIGQQVSVDGSQIRIAQKAGNHAMKKQMQTLIDSLAAISNELKSQNPDKKRISKVYQSFKGTWVPSLITSVLAHILTQGIGMVL